MSLCKVENGVTERKSHIRAINVQLEKKTYLQTRVRVHRTSF